MTIHFGGVGVYETNTFMNKFSNIFCSYPLHVPEFVLVFSWVSITSKYTIMLMQMLLNMIKIGWLIDIACFAINSHRNIHRKLISRKVRGANLS